MRFLAFFFILSLFATAATAQFAVVPTTDGLVDCSAPALASDPEGMAALAFEISGETSSVGVQFFYTTQTDYIEIPETTILNAGSMPVVCWSWDGYRVAFVSGNSILIYQSYGAGSWDLENFTTLPVEGTVRSLELMGASYHPDGPFVFLAVHTSDQSGGTNRVHFASCDDSGWTTLGSLNFEAQMTNPQMTVAPYTPSPILYFVGGPSLDELHLKSSVLHPSNGWSEPVMIIDLTGFPSPIVHEFDVSESIYGDINILGLGATPTCPCGSIHLHSYHSVVQTWTVSEVTESYAFFDLPLSPKIASSEFGETTHLFWFQEATSEFFTPMGKTLEYRIIENDGIVDAGDFLDEAGQNGTLGSQVALTVGAQNTPVLAWTRVDTIAGEPQPGQIWVAKHWDPSAVPENDITRPLPVLSAWPNPFNPLVNIAFDVDETQTFQLDVFDARGRHVKSLLDQVMNDGHAEITWNATNDMGRRLPSGVYFARLVSSHGETVSKLVLAE